jgi:ATP-dependent Clp protease, protease subunit
LNTASGVPAMIEIKGGLPFQPQTQRYREYARQRQMTLGDLLLENRIVFLGSSPETGGNPAITDYLANVTIQKLLFLQYENKSQEIHFYINCPGGSVTATLAIYDTMQFLECPISTYCMGLAASGAAIILAAGTKGKRYCLPNSKVMIHQPWGQVGGQISDIEIQANEITKERHRLNEILAKHTGQPLPAIEKETDRDRYFGADEAKAFGLVDEVLTKAAEEKKK